MASVIKFTTVDYPESDGKPMGETDDHVEEIFRLRELLKGFYAGQSVYLSANVLVFYKQGAPKKFVVPDVFVVKGIEPGNRKSYKIWVEGKPPSAIIEVTSRKTKKRDTVTKPALYRRLQVPEYFLFDLTRDYLDPPLQGYRMIGGRYKRIAADAEGSLLSDQLGLRLRAEGRHLTLDRSDTGQRLLTEAEARWAAEEALRAEAQMRRAVEEALRAEGEARRAEAQARQAAEEARRTVEAELARLRQQLRRRDGT
jgi:Uma2 family endonuclease